MICDCQIRGMTQNRTVKTNVIRDAPMYLFFHTYMVPVKVESYYLNGLLYSMTSDQIFLDCNQSINHRLDHFLVHSFHYFICFVGVAVPVFLVFLRKNQVILLNFFLHNHKIKIQMQNPCIQ